MKMSIVSKKVNFRSAFSVYGKNVDRLATAEMRSKK